MDFYIKLESDFDVQSRRKAFFGAEDTTSESVNEKDCVFKDNDWDEMMVTNFGNFETILNADFIKSELPSLVEQGKILHSEVDISDIRNVEEDARNKQNKESTTINKRKLLKARRHPRWPKRKPSRNAANVRERYRMRVLSDALFELRQILPWIPPETRLSKLDTLRLACSYIEYLSDVLGLTTRKSCHNVK